MKRDADLIRTILLTLEEVRAGESVTGHDLRSVAPDEQVLVEHLQLLDDAGLIEAHFERSLDRFMQPSQVHIDRITWDGHEFLDAIRSDTVWEKTKERAAKVGGTVSLKVLGEVAGSVAKGMLGLS